MMTKSRLAGEILNQKAVLMRISDGYPAWYLLRNRFRTSEALLDIEGESSCHTRTSIDASESLYSMNERK
jgi:hypothetical protein